MGAYFHVVSMHKMASCTWQLSLFRPTVDNIFSGSLRDIELLLKNYRGELPRCFPEYDYDYCQASTKYHMDLLQKEQNFSIPVVLYPIDGRYCILDGNHRVAATFMIKPNIFKIPAWIAKV